MKIKLYNNGILALKLEKVPINSGPPTLTKGVLNRFYMVAQSDYEF